MESLHSPVHVTTQQPGRPKPVTKRTPQLIQEFINEISRHQEGCLPTVGGSSNPSPTITYDMIEAVCKEAFGNGLSLHHNSQDENDEGENTDDSDSDR
jgi:hypothetical protein